MTENLGNTHSRPRYQAIRRTDERGQFKPDRTNAYIGLQIRTGRRLLGWSRGALADQLGIDARLFAEYEYGEREVPAVLLAQVAEMLGKPLPWFYNFPVTLSHLRGLGTVRGQSGDAQAKAPAAPAQKAIVLLADDAPDVLVTLGAFLEGAGLQVIRASSGDEALRVIASDQVLHAVVTDNAMPGLSGTELLLQVAQLRPSLPGLIVTGYADAGVLGDLPPSVGVLSKPFRREELVRRVHELIVSRGEAAQRAAGTVGVSQG